MNAFIHKLLRWGLGELDARILMSELDELYLHKADAEGKARAERWIRREAVRAGLRAVAERIRTGIAAIRPTERSVSTVQLLGIQSLLQDLRYGVRMLRKRPMFAATAILSLGLGIGAATTMFGVVDGVLLSELEFENPGELVTIWETLPRWRGNEILDASWDRNFLSYPEYENVREHGTVFQDVAIYGDRKMVLTGTGEPVELTVGNATASLAGVLKIQPVLGRWFLPGEDGTAAGQLAVLDHAFWQGRFGADPSILGKAVTLDDRSYTVVGVLPPKFRFRMLLNRSVADPGARAIWVPTGSAGIKIGQGNHSYEGIARLRPGITPERAKAETEALVRGGRDPSEVGVRLLPRSAAETSDVRSPLVLLLGATVVLLGIACGNVATLLFSENAYRRTEIAIRSALGAGGWRICRQLIVESLLLGVLGSAVGACLALAGTRLLVALGPPIPRLSGVSVDGRVLVFAALAGMASGLAFGLIPAFSAARGSAGIQVGADVHRTTRRNRGIQRSVVALEVALTAVLLIGGGLLIRSLSNLLSVDPGFDAANIVVTRIAVSEQRYPTPADRISAYRELVERMEAVPGVGRASGTHRLPFLDRPSGNTIRLVEWEPGKQVMARIATVLPGFHEILGIPILAGRGLDTTDSEDSQTVMIVNESMARRFWPNESALGHRVRWDQRVWIVVGIAGDVIHKGLDEDIESTFYVPHSQTGYAQMTMVASTSGDPRSVLPQLRKAVWSVDPDLPVTIEGSLEALISRSTAEERYRAMLMTLFAGIAMLLAAAGVFGTTARGVAQRTREMGIRHALGARGRDLVGTMMRENLTTSTVGILLGLMCAFWISRLLARYLFGIEPRDPLTFASVSLLLVLVCFVSGYFPARRVAKVDPAEALRVD